MPTRTEHEIRITGRLEGAIRDMNELKGSAKGAADQVDRVQSGFTRMKTQSTGFRGYAARLAMPAQPISVGGGGGGGIWNRVRGAFGRRGGGGQIQGFEPTIQQPTDQGGGGGGGNGSNRPWYDRGAIGQGRQFIGRTLGVAMGEGLIGMFREAIGQAREWQDILTNTASTFRPVNLAQTKKAINDLGTAYAYFQEEAFQITEALGKTQGLLNTDVQMSVGRAARLTGAPASDLARLTGRLQRFTSGGGLVANRALSASYAGNVGLPGMRQESLMSDLAFQNQLAQQGYTLTGGQSRMLSGQMAAISKYMGPAYAGRDAARVMGGLQGGIQGATGGIGGALLVRAAMRVGTANVGGQELDLTNPFHLKRFQEAGLRSPGGIKVAREMFNIAQGYGDKDAALEMLKQAFPQLSYQDLSGMMSRNMMGKLTDRGLLNSLTAGGNVPPEDEKGWQSVAYRRREYVGLEQNLRKVGTAAENLHIEFTNMVEAVLKANGGLGKLGTLIEQLWENDNIRNFMLGSSFLAEPGPVKGAALGLSMTKGWFEERGRDFGSWLFDQINGSLDNPIPVRQRRTNR